MRGQHGQRRRWIPCPTCKMLILTPRGIGEHRCPDKLRSQVQAELDIAVYEAMEDFDQEAEWFWDTPDVKFTKWLIDNDRLG